MPYRKTFHILHIYRALHPHTNSLDASICHLFYLYNEPNHAKVDHCHLHKLQDTLSLTVNEELGKFRLFIVHEIEGRVWLTSMLHSPIQSIFKCHGKHIKFVTSWVFAHSSTLDSLYSQPHHIIVPLLELLLPNGRFQLIFVRLSSFLDLLAAFFCFLNGGNGLWLWWVPGAFRKLHVYPHIPVYFLVEIWSRYLVDVR